MVDLITALRAGARLGFGEDEATANTMGYAADHIEQLERVTACLLDHYLNCYEGNKDALALEAESLVPEWRKLMREWEPKRGPSRRQDQ